MAFHWIDYVIMGVVALSVITGLFRGFIKELIALCIWILAIWLAFKYSPALDPHLSPYIQDKTAKLIVAFVGILLSTVIVGGVCNALLSFVLRRSGLSSMDRLLGMGFGFVRGVFIVALVFAGIKMTSIPDKAYTENSSLYPILDPLVNQIHAYMPDLLKQAKAYDKSDHSLTLDTKDVNQHSN